MFTIPYLAIIFLKSFSNTIVAPYFIEVLTYCFRKFTIVHRSFVKLILNLNMCQTNLGEVNYFYGL